jgi:hypothetical protein
MVLFYSLVSRVSIKRYRIADTFPDGVFKHLKIMCAAFGFLYINDLQAVLLGYDLRLQRVALFFSE